MAVTDDAGPGRLGTTAAPLLVGGIVLASLTEAIASTVLSLGRNDMLGDVHATPDEFAWLDVGYTASKMIAFMVAPWLMSRIEPRILIVGATLAMGAASGIAAVTTHLALLIAIRTVQGLLGGLLLVVGQAVLFLAYSRARQPILQALFAMGAVVAPATLAPAFQGWLIDSQSWTWIFLSVIPLAFVASGLFMLANAPALASLERRPFDWIGIGLISVVLFCLTYVLNQGARWDWLEEPRIRWLTMLGVTTSAMFLAQQILIRGTGLLNFALFASKDFSFAFIVSFVAGAALFGSAFLIPAFAVSVLSFTPTDAGLLLLPSGGLFVGSLLIAAYVMQAHRAPPIATVPFGIVMVMISMWMLSNSTSESGADDMMQAILLRGVGLGFLFLSITLIAFNDLSQRSLGAGIGLFNAGRQIGGMLGVAALQTMINHHVASNAAVLGTYIVPGNSTVTERLKATASMLSFRGMDAVEAGHASMSLLGGAVIHQSNVMAFDTAFIAIALLFVVAAPAMVAVKVGLSRRWVKPSATVETSKGLT